MKDLLCLSLDYTRAGTTERDAARSRWWNMLRRLKDEEHILEGVLVATCNRTELYLRLPSGKTVPAELSHPGARILSGEEMVLHLLRVLLGLESLACGESSIVGQVRKSYSDSGDLCGSWLHRLFQSALRMAKILRTCYHPGMEPSVPWLMAEKLKSHPSFPRLSVLLLGAGDMGRETARILSSLGVSFTVANRTEERARELAGVFDTPVLSWEKWRNEAPRFDTLFFCTGSPLPVFSAENARKGQWLFDLGSPPQVEKNRYAEKQRCHQAQPQRSLVAPPSQKTDDLFLLAMDDLAGTAADLTAEYRKKLRRLEDEAADAAGSIRAELTSLSAETYKRLVLRRAERIVEGRAERTAKKTGADPEILRRMGWSVVRALLSPAFGESDPHARRLWKILAGDMEDSEDE